MSATESSVNYSLPASVLAMQNAILGQDEAKHTLPQSQRSGPGDQWLATDALSYAFLGIPVLKGEVVDDSGELQDIGDSEGAQWVCLSPNSTELFKPALGLRAPHLFGDGCYGFDDRSRWPQMYSSKFESYACIPRFSSARSILWWAPTKLATIPIPGAADLEVCILSPRILQQFRSQSYECCDMVWKAMETHKGDEPGLLVTHLIETLDRLAMGFSYRTLVQNVGEFQRTCLDLFGWVNFVSVFQPRTFIRNAGENKLYDVDTSIMGAFTHSIPTAQRLYRIGIPVYLILSSTQLPANMNVKLSSPTTLQTTSMGRGAPDIVTEEFMSSHHGPYPFPVLTYKFPGANLQEALQRFSIRLSSRRQSAIGATSTDAVEREVTLEPHSAKFLPFVVYNLSKGSGPLSNAGIAPVSMATAADPRLMDVQPILSWKEILDRYASGTYDKGSSEELKGTAMPSPNLFKYQKDEGSKNCRIYAAAYISLRPAYLPTIIDAALATGQPRSFPTGQQWRNFLITFKKNIPIPDGVNIRSEPPKAKKKRSGPSAAPGPSAKRPCRPASSATTSLSTGTTTLTTSPSSSSTTAMSSVGPSNASSAPQPTSKSTGGDRRYHPLHQSLTLREKVTEICWLDKRIPVLSLRQIEREITDDMLSEIRWEVHEQNFRLELLILDQVLCPGLWKVGEGDSEEVRSARKRRELAVRRVFPLNGRLHGNFFVQAIPNVDGGLAARDLFDRAPFLLAFREVVLDWPACPRSIRDTVFDTTKGFDVSMLESLVVAEYCSRFLHQFGRLPVPPVRLPFASLSRQAPAEFYSGLPSDEVPT